MARPHGFDHFCNYLSGLENLYVIIGGGAASILMEDEGLEFRATKDVDLVVLSRSDELNTRILSYIKEGGYKTKEATEGSPRYYRFREPTKKDCPALIEVFARNELNLDLQDGQYIIPIHDVAVERLSAILLDDEYFEIIQKNLVTSQSGIPLINALANICLKARAHRELFDRKAAGDKTVDEKVVQKHLKDIWRIAAVLTGDEEITLTGQPLKDVTSAISKLDQFPGSQFNQVMEKTPQLRKETIMTALKKVFLKN